ncbi:MAG: hypothetical protein M0R80_13190 [Proteobacteria bacterium]|jgi:hypothetical protein|nr:hypothetical protein [Pseudomonadota bacterium]
MIREVLDNLVERDRRVLLHAFDTDLSQYIETSKDRFVGVHIDPNNKKFKITESVGAWSIGELTHEM